jgi:hypothetical protein
LERGEDPTDDLKKAGLDELGKKWAQPDSFPPGGVGFQPAVSAFVPTFWR